MSAEGGTHSGFVALAGRPNVGKSTLANRLAGRKVAIVSEKPQTTRTTIRAIATRPAGQAVFVDTPGLHRPFHKLGEFMVRAARSSLRAVDLVAWVVDATAGHIHPADRHVGRELAPLEKPVLLVVNKLDRVSREEAEALADRYRELVAYREAYLVSALTGEGVEAFLQGVLAALPPGPLYYDAGVATDQPEAFVIGEFIREKVLEYTREEVPHAVAVVVEALERRETGVLYARAELFVERESQKRILIGEGGQMLRRIGTAARQEAEALFGVRVFLDLHVKVQKGWRDREGALWALGYREE